MITEQPMNYYTNMKKLEGSRFGAIHLMERKSDKQLLVLKQVDQNSEEDRVAAINECCLMRYIDSPYVLSCEEVFDFDNKVWMFLQYMPGGDLTKILNMAKSTFTELSEEFCKYTLYCVAQGVADMHSNGVLHRDIKSDNVLFKDDGTIKIADLGFAVKLTDAVAWRSSQLGTLAWMSPENAQGQPYAEEVDVWSFGCFAFELTKGEPPLMALANDVGNFIEELTQQEVVERIPDRYSDEFADFVAMAMQKDKLDRWTM